jgi:hypothetical protein
MTSIKGAREEGVAICPLRLIEFEWLAGTKTIWTRQIAFEFGRVELRMKEDAHRKGKWEN